MFLNAIGHGVGLVDLVDGHNDRHIGSLSVIDGFQRLRHHAVIGGDDQHNDVRDLRSASAHAGKGFVTWCIEEDDLAAVSRRVLVSDRDFIGTDVLRYSASFALSHTGLANGIEQAGLAVVDVPHDGNHGWPRYSSGTPFFAGTLGWCSVLGQLLFEADDVGRRAEVARHFAGQLGIERLVDSRKYATREQTRDQILGADFKLLGQVFDADAFWNRNTSRDRQRLTRQRQPRRRHEALHRAFLHATRDVTLSGTRWTTRGTLACRRRRRYASTGACSE